MNLKDLETFKLNKVQMNEVTGGSTCLIQDRESGYHFTAHNENLSAEAAQESMTQSYGSWAYVLCY